MTNFLYFIKSKKNRTFAFVRYFPNNICFIPETENSIIPILQIMRYLLFVPSLKLLKIYKFFAFRVDIKAYNRYNKFV